MKKSNNEDNQAPPGYVLVDVVLTTHQAFIVRKWEAAAKSKIEAARAATLQRFDARNDDSQFRPGVRCEIIGVHHPCFSKDIGKIVVVTKVSADFRQVWAHADTPVTYRINRSGRKVVAYDPTCIQTIYGMENLRVLG